MSLMCRTSTNSTMRIPPSTAHCPLRRRRMRRSSASSATNATATASTIRMESQRRSCTIDSYGYGSRSLALSPSLPPSLPPSLYLSLSLSSFFPLTISLSLSLPLSLSRTHIHYLPLLYSQTSRASCAARRPPRPSATSRSTRRVCAPAATRSMSPAGPQPPRRAAHCARDGRCSCCRGR